MTALPLALGHPAVEVARADDGDRELWSVTTIIDVLNKPALIPWAAKETAAAAVDDLDLLNRYVANQGRDEAVKWLSGARFRVKDRLSATQLGQVFHAVAEVYALTGTRPTLADIAETVAHEGGDGFRGVNAEANVVARMLDRFDEWCARFQPEYDATEVVVYHPTYGYAGTADAFVVIAGVPLIVDYKTSRDPRDSQGRPKTPYPEAALQVAAYRHAESAAVWRPRRTERFRRRVYLLSDAERDQAVPVPATDGGVVVHVTPESCEAFPVRCDDRVFTSFLYVVEAARWSFDLAHDVVGIPLVPESAS